MAKTITIEDKWTPRKDDTIFKPKYIGQYEYDFDAFNPGTQTAYAPKKTTAKKKLENKAGETIYKDSQLEVYVKNDKEIDDFIRDFNLDDLGLKIRYWNYDKYQQEGLDVDRLKQAEGGLFNVNKNISQSNYTDKFPYVAEIAFKNLWGCDMAENLRTYIKYCNFLIDYNRQFAKNIIEKEDYNYRFFQKGYITAAYIVFGETFENDEHLGSNKLNKYVTISTTNKTISYNWKNTTDSILKWQFANNNSRWVTPYSSFNPYSQYQSFTPVLGLPYFKDKEFTDSYIYLELEKQDKLGNTYKRIVKLPIHILFYNNLIKMYWIKDGGYISGGIVYEYEASTNVLNYSYKKGNYYGYSEHCIWTPDCNKLNYTATFSSEKGTPFTSQSFNSWTPLTKGQLGLLYFQFGDKKNGYVDNDHFQIEAIFQFSDGSLYDIFHQQFNYRVNN